MALRARVAGVAVKDRLLVPLVLVLQGLMVVVGALMLAENHKLLALEVTATPAPARKPNSAYHCRKYLPLDPDLQAKYLAGLKDIYGRDYEPCADRDQALVSLLGQTLAPSGTPAPTDRPRPKEYVIGAEERSRR